MQECESREQEGGEVERRGHDELAAQRSLCQQGGLHGNASASHHFLSHDFTSQSGAEQEITETRAGPSSLEINFFIADPVLDFFF